jgi:hypothetical protein
MPKQLFKDKDLQLLMFDKRMKFHSPDGCPDDVRSRSVAVTIAGTFHPKTNYYGRITSKRVTLKQNFHLNKTGPLKCPYSMRIESTSKNLHLQHPERLLS